MSAAWGFDIGRQAIKACRIRALKEGLELDAVASVRLEIPEGADEKAIAEASRRAVAGLVEQFGIVDPVLVATPGHTTFSKVIRVQATD